MNKVLTYSQIEEIEIELASQCNLKCPLCLSQNKLYKQVRQTKSADEWKSKLDQFPNVKHISIAGFSTEPTLYPQLIEIVDYLKNRNIAIELYTNGNTHDEQWWKELALHFKKDDKIIFTVCGSTQELHAKYRVGSDLNQLIANVKAFKNTACNDWIKILKFKYNHDDISNIVKLVSFASHIIITETVPFNERFFLHKENDGLSLPIDKKFYYNLCIKTKRQSQIECRSFVDKFINIDSQLDVYPCFLYKMYANNNFNLDYADILAYKHDFCYECEKNIKQLLAQYKIEQMV